MSTQPSNFPAGLGKADWLRYADKHKGLSLLLTDGAGETDRFQANSSTKCIGFWGCWAAFPPLTSPLLLVDGLLGGPLTSYFLLLTSYLRMGCWAALSPLTSYCLPLTCGWVVGRPSHLLLLTSYLRMGCWAVLSPLTSHLLLADGLLGGD